MSEKSPKYFIVNNDEVVAFVYERNGHKVILIRVPKIDIIFGLKFLNIEGKVVEDDETRDILTEFFNYGKNKGFIGEKLCK